MKIVLYSTHCAKCNVVKMKLDKANLEYTMIDDQDEVVKFGNSHHITSAPILVVDDKVYDFSGAVKFLNEVK